MNISKNNGGIRSSIEARQQAMCDMSAAGIIVNYFNKESLIRQLCNQENILPLSVLDSIQSIAIDKQLGDYKYECLHALPPNKNPPKKIQLEYNILKHKQQNYYDGVCKPQLTPQNRNRLYEIEESYIGIIIDYAIDVPMLKMINISAHDYFTFRQHHKKYKYHIK
jgi:hypothetical protein